MAAGKSCGSTGEITFLEGTSISALAGVRRKIQENVPPSRYPDTRLLALSRLWGGRWRYRGRGLPGLWRGGNVQ